MELKDAKKLIKKVGVKSWLEAGVNVVKVGDKLLNSTDTFSRLDFYTRRGNGVKFCEEKELNIPCGEIKLSNGAFLRYNIL
nr:MAG TPA: hypothetical protein [Caudoviricetes sp.]